MKGILVLISIITFIGLCRGETCRDVQQCNHEVCKGSHIACHNNMCTCDPDTNSPHNDGYSTKFISSSGMWVFVTLMCTAFSVTTAVFRMCKLKNDDRRIPKSKSCITMQDCDRVGLCLIPGATLTCIDNQCSCVS